MKTTWAVYMAFPVRFSDCLDQNNSGNTNTDPNRSVIANPPVGIVNSQIQSSNATSQTIPPMQSYSNDYRFSQSDHICQRNCHCNSILQRHPSISRLGELRINQRRHSSDSITFLPENHVARFHRLSLPETGINSDQISDLRRQYENDRPGNNRLNARRRLSLPADGNFFSSRSNCFCERLLPQSFQRADHTHFEDNPWVNILGALLVKFIHEELQLSCRDIPWCLNGFVPENNDFTLLFRCTQILAKKFSKTANRRQIENLASNVNMWSLTNDSYLNMLESLCPPDRVTADRLILLFFFCSDILLRSLRQNNENFCYLMEWSKQYLNGLSPACILKSLGNRRNKPLTYAVTSACIVGAFALWILICNKDFHWRK